MAKHGRGEAKGYARANLRGIWAAALTPFCPDDLAVDARIVSGVYPQDFMNGALGRMLCLYTRKSERAEVQEIPPLWVAGDEVQLK